MKKKLYNELHNLYTSPNIITAMKSRMARWEGRVACMMEIMYTNFWSETSTEEAMRDT